MPLRRGSRTVAGAPEKDYRTVRALSQQALQCAAHLMVLSQNPPVGSQDFVSPLLRLPLGDAVTPKET